MHTRILLLLIAILLLGDTPSGVAQQHSMTRQSPRLRVSDQLSVNYFESDPERFETHLVITDVEGSGPIVNVLMHDEQGTLVHEESYFLPIFGKVNYNPTERVGGTKFRGSIRIIADGGTVAAQFWQFYRDAEKGPFNTAIPASDGQGAPALLCQHFVADPRIDAKLVLRNPASDSAITVAVMFYLDRGKQLTRDRHVIPPNGILVINPYEANEGLIKTGVAYCEVLTPGATITGEYWQASSFEEYQVSLPLEEIPKRERDW